MKKLRNWTWPLLALSLSGCVNLGLTGDKDAPPILYYVLEDGGRSAPAFATSPRTLLLVETTASAFYDSDGIAFSNQPGTRGYYQFARWSERPGKRFADLLLARIDREKIFATVAQTDSNVRGDWLLATEILDFHHAAETRPGIVRMELRAELVELKTRTLLARKRFVQSVPAASFDAKGAHQAFNEAATRTLDQLADWLKDLASKS